MYLVLFDCDGTLVDSQAMIVAAMEHAFRDTGLAPPARAATLSIVGLSLPVAMTALTANLPDAPVAALVDAYRTAFQRLRSEPVDREPPYPGALETIAALASEDDLLLGVVTGKSRRGLDGILARHGIADRFVTLKTADDAPSKPDPTMVRLALAEAGVPASRAVVVGDTTFDMDMARAAGAAAIGVSWGYHPTERLVAAGADRLIDDFAALPGAVRAVFAARALVAS
jgi:phosphoglycolate phosphatase